MSVRVVKDPGTTTDNRDYVRVSTSPDPNDDTVTLATIQRIVEKLNLERASAPKLHVKTLIMQQPMTPDAALGLATCYAERKQIPVVVAETD